MSRKSKNIVYLLFVFSMLLLTGCVKRLTLEDLPKEQKVLKYVDGQCPEPYSYTGSEVDDDRGGITYYFLTDWGFEFTAHSYISQGFLTNDTTRLSNEYASAVRLLYKEQAEAVIENNSLMKDLDFSGTVSVMDVDIASYDDLSGIVQTLDELNEIWKQELALYSHSFAMASIHIRWNAAKADGLSSSRIIDIGTAEIDGTLDAESLLEDLQESYRSLYQSGDVLYFNEETSDSDRMLQALYPVVIDERNCHYIDVTYNEEREAYYVDFVSNITHYGTEPWEILEETVGMEWENHVEYDDSNMFERNPLKQAWCEWTINGTTWKISYRIDRSAFNLKKDEQLTLEKDGVITDEIEFLDLNPENDTGLAYAVSLDDFCRLFDLQYEIDSINGSIAFVSNSASAEHAS